MTDDFEPLIHPETGDHVGWMTTASDGAKIGLDLDGYITGALDPSTGELLDHTQYVPADDPDDAYTALDGRLDRIEQAVNEPRPPVYLQPDPAIDGQRLNADLEAQKPYVVSALGREPTRREWIAIIGDVHDQMAAGDRRPDLIASLNRVAALGESNTEMRILNPDSDNRNEAREARQAMMFERLQEIEHDQTGAGPLDPTPPRMAGYNDERHEDRVARALDRLEGRTTAEEAAAMTGSGYNPAEVEWQPEEDW